MAFHVDITEPALADAEGYVRFIRDVKKEPEAAERWFRGLLQAIFSLEELPERCAPIPEREDFPFEIRHLIYFSHRIIFRIELESKRVVVEPLNMTPFSKSKPSRFPSPIKEVERLECTLQNDRGVVKRLIEEAKASPLTSTEMATEIKRLAAYGASQTKALGVNDKDIVRRIH